MITLERRAHRSAPIELALLIRNRSSWHIFELSILQKIFFVTIEMSFQ